MKRVENYRTIAGREPFQEWIDGLDLPSRAKIYAYVIRVAQGAARKNVEIKINAGPGFRVYFGELGRVVILLLLGGDKSTQERDIRLAKVFWREYVSKQILR